MVEQRSTKQIVDLSVILPCHNEADNIQPLLARLMPQIDKLDVNAEIIAVDDGSTDRTYAVLVVARESDPRVKIIMLSRNFGKEAAVSAGLALSSGANVLIMDADLQHPPELLETMLQTQSEGADVVYGQRRSRSTDGWLRRFFSRNFYKAFSLISDVKIPPDSGDFRLMSRPVVDTLNALPEQSRFMKGLYAWIGYSQVGLFYDAEPRRSGRSSWSLVKLFGYAWDGIMSFSAAPLRIWSLIGILIAAVALCYALWVVVSTLIFGNDVPGYATLASALFFLGGLQILSIGVLGEYLARMFNETKRRPIYIIKNTQGIDDGN